MTFCGREELVFPICGTRIVDNLHGLITTFCLPVAMKLCLTITSQVHRLHLFFNFFFLKKTKPHFHRIYFKKVIIFINFMCFVETKGGKYGKNEKKSTFNGILLQENKEKLVKFTLRSLATNF